MNSKAAAIFETAVALPPEHRAAYLDAACQGDAQLRQRVEALLRAHEAAGQFMSEPAAPPADRTVRISAPLTEKPGDKIGHYKLLQQIGEGGCGVVYMAEQEEPIRRRVAFKVIKLGMDTRQVIARFEAERQALALMDHPNIARVLDAGATDTGRPYFVMELVRGVRITDYCDQNNLSTEQRLDLFIQVCHAIQHAHQKGIIHRDIKPSNILVTVNDGVPVPKVIDFGIAKATGGQQLTDKTLFTAFEQFIGTPAYMSPEQMEMTSLDIDTRSDIYALGVLLYELLTGHTPFDAKTLLAAGLEEMRRIIREQEPVRPSTRISSLAAAEQTTVAKRRQSEPPKLIHQVRGDLDWIVMKCLEKDRTRRYETANAMAVDLDHHLRHEPVSAAAPGTMYRVGKFVRRHKVGLGMAGALVVLLVLGVVVSTWQAMRATRAEHKAQAEANKSQQVAQFLKDMLEGVGPSVALGRDTVLLKEILDKTAERAGKELTSQPEVEANLRATIGEVYAGLGRYSEAEAMTRRVLELRKQLFGEEHTSVADALDAVAHVLRYQARLPEAEALYREAWRLRRKSLGQGHPKIAESLGNVAGVLWNEGKLADAETLYREELALRRRQSPTRPEVAIGLNNLATVLLDLGRPKDAEAAIREALLVYRQAAGEDPTLASFMNNLAQALQAQGKEIEAEEMCRQVLVLRGRLLGPDHPEVAFSLCNLAAYLYGRGKFPEAESLLRQSIEIQRKKLGNQHPDLARSLDNLAAVVRREGKLADGEALCREALGIYQKVFGPEHPDAVAALNNLAAFLREQNKLPDAEITCREAVRLRRKVLGDEHPDVARSLESLAVILIAEGKMADAAGAARECLAIREKKIPDDWRTFRARSLLGQTLLGQTQYGEAEPLLVSGYQGMEERRGKIPVPEAFVRRDAVRCVVRLYRALNRTNQVAEWEGRLAELEREGPKSSGRAP